MTRGFSPRMVQNEPSAASSRTTDHGSRHGERFTQGVGEVVLLDGDPAHRRRPAGATRGRRRRAGRSRRPRPAGRRAQHPPPRLRRASAGRTRAPSRASGTARSGRDVAGRSSSDWSTSDCARRRARRGRARRPRRRARSRRGRSTASAAPDVRSWSQQVPRPVDDREQRLVTVGRGAVAAAEQGEPVVEPAVDVLDRHRAHPGGRQLDGQGQPVEPAHDAQHRRRGRGPPRDARPWPAGANSRTPRRRSSWHRGKTRSAAIARGARVVVTTRRPRAGRDEEGHQVGDRPDHVLAVVEDEQRGRPGQSSARCARARRGAARGVRIRRPLTESRTPRAGADLADDVCRVRRPRRARRSAPPAARPPGRAACARRVLPNPPGPRIETTRDSRTSARSARMSSSRPIRVSTRGAARLRTGLSAASSCACTATNTGPGSTPSRSARSRRTRAYRSRAAGVPWTAASERSRATAVSSSSTPASSSSGRASRWSPRADRAAAEHRSGLGAPAAGVTAQDAQRAVTAGCRDGAGQSPSREVAGRHPVSVRLGLDGGGEVVAEV